MQWFFISSIELHPAIIFPFAVSFEVTDAANGQVCCSLAGWLS